MQKASKEITPQQQSELIAVLKTRFEKNNSRHSNIEWSKVQEKLEANPEKSWSLQQMEETGGEPDVVGFDSKTNEYIFFDCSEESPKGRRSFCYDNKALKARKEHKPKNSALGMADEMGVELLTSSWLKTPADIRKLGGAIFGDFRYNRVFIYHNGVESYYAARGFRGALRV